MNYSSQKELEKLAEKLSMAIMHNETGFYELVYKSVLKDLNLLVYQAEQKMKDKCMRAIYEVSPTIVGMRQDEAELWGKATSLFLKTLASLDKKII